jgi:hypothetical protein
VIQIKPQLERVLNLTDDSLTKEIKLTQDLLQLLIKYQIPSDLLSFDASNNSGSSFQDRLDAVKRNVVAMQELINEAKRTSIEEKNMEREFLYGSKRSDSDCQSNSDGCEDECMMVEEDMVYEARPQPEIAVVTLPQKSRGKSFLRKAVAFGGAAFGFKKKERASYSDDIQRLEKSDLRGASPFPAPSAVSMSQQMDPFADINTGSSMPSTSQPAETVSSSPPEDPQQQKADPTSSGGSEVALDYTEIPTLLDQKYEKFDLNNSLRPTIINVGTAWEKKSQATLLSSPITKSLTTDDQTMEKNAAFDLIDALTRSGALVLEHAALHVVIAATHNFDQTLMDTVVQKNINPIERVEHSSLIIASTLHSVPPQELISDKQLDRVLTYSPTLFIEN